MRIRQDAPWQDQIDIARRYFKESAYSRVGEFDEDRWKQIWEYFVKENSCAAFLLEDEGQIGFAMLQISHEFIKDAFLGDVYQFYIAPEYRGTKASRYLRDVCDDWFRHMGTRANFVSCAAGMGEENNKLFRNLWAKSGYEVLGTELFQLRK